MIKNLAAKIDNWKLEYIYLFSGIILGILMLFLTPPFQVPDEGAHFLKAWSVAGGNFFCSGNDFIPPGAAALPGKINFIKVEDVKGYKVTSDNIKSELFSGQSDGPETYLGKKSNICNVLPIGYLPQALGLNAGKIFDITPLAQFYSGRFFNLLVAALIVFWAIRLIPYGKIVFTIIALLPITIQQFASLSYDPLTISIAFLFTAYILKLASEKDKLLSKKEMLVLFLLSLFGLHIKAGYFLLTFLVLILPKQKFSNPRNYWLFSFLIIAVNAALFQVIRMVFLDFGSMALAKGVDAAEQLKNVTEHPFDFIDVVGHSLRKNFKFYYQTLILKPGWMDYGLPYNLYMFIIFGAFFLIKNAKDKVELSIRQRLIFLSCFIANLLFIFLSLYLVWTKVGGTRVQGVQGRYFLPAFPLLILFFYRSGSGIRILKNKVPNNLFLILYLLIVYFFTFRALIEIYYI